MCIGVNEPNSIGYTTVINEARNNYRGYTIVHALKCNLKKLQAVSNHAKNVTNSKSLKIRIIKTKEILSLFTIHSN